MVKSYRIVWIVPILLLTTASIIPRVKAVEPYAKMYPEKGDVFTDIYVQVRGLETFFDYATTNRLGLYLFWDDMLVIENLENPKIVYAVSTTWFGYYDVHTSAPNEYPYSELGNHTVYIEIWKYDQFCINFTLTFEIIEYYPPTSDWWKWWESVPDEIKANLTGAQGLQGIQGIQGEQGIQGIQGVKGDKGDKGDIGPYPIEAVQLNLSLSAVSVVTFIIAASMLYKTKKLTHS